MDIGGGVKLTAEQVNAWKTYDLDEYNDYVENGLFDEDTLELSDIPEWMNDGDPLTGPFDFGLNQSHGTIGW